MQHLDMLVIMNVYTYFDDDDLNLMEEFRKERVEDEQKK
jgi:hypothetical protein